MSAAAKVIPMPEPTYRESITRQGNWTAVPMPILRHMIDAWYQDHEGVKAPDWVAELDCLYWNDRGAMKPARYFEKRWKWGHRKALEFLKARGLVTEKEPARNHKGTTKEPIIPAPQKESAIQEPQRNHKGTSEEPVLPDSQKELKQVGETRATAPPQTPPPKPIDPWNPHHAPPDLDAVIGHGAKIGVGAADAEEFYHHYTAAGWRAGNGNAIAHWGSKLKSWSLDTKRKSGGADGKRHAASAGKPQSSYERRMDAGLAEKIRTSREAFRRASGLDGGEGGNDPGRGERSGFVEPLDPNKRLPG
jgi:hypothetical protein